MHYYQFNIGDYARDTGHLTVVEHGIYRLLLDWCYLNEKPITTEQAIRVGRGFPTETQSVLSEFFSQTEGSWTHKRVESEVQSYHRKSEANRQNGAKGGRPKAKDNPVGLRSDSENKANQTLTKEPITNNQEPIRESAPASQASPPANPKTRGRKPKSEATTLKDHLANCKAASIKPIPDDHYVRRWAADAGIAPEMLQIAWVKFRERYTESEKGKGKKYKDWAGHFATSVKDNWFKLWFADADNGGVRWTSNGLTCKAVLDARIREETNA